MTEQTMSKEKQIDLLERQLAFWKHHCTELVKALEKEEEISNHYAQMLDKTEEELNEERVKNEEQGCRKQSEGEWIDQYQGKYVNKLYKCSIC